MSCDCHSYNWDVGRKPEVVLQAPAFITDCQGKHKGTVCVDACIAHVIEHLWSNGVVTFGCCCGHNRHKHPEVIIETGATASFAERVHRLISEVDKREWKVLAWQTKLCEYAGDHWRSYKPELY